MTNFYPAASPLLRLTGCTRQTTEMFDGPPAGDPLKHTVTTSAHFAVVDDARPLDLRSASYRRVEPTFRANAVSVYWTNGELTSVSVRGHQLLKSGDVGVTDLKAEYRAKATYSDELPLTEVPERVVEAIADFADAAALGQVGDR
ncbi:hypothetical protein SEA_LITTLEMUNCHKIN_55 [Gordonia phage LittleMunchkin]|nr:hypothetical protein SEA_LITTLEMUNCHKIN_55 [Gordonia phage LittleMunchkin]